MKLTLDASQGVNLIRAYSSDAVRVGEQVLRRSCIVTRDAVIANWRPAELADVRESDLEPLFAANVELVLLGTGFSHQFAPADLRGAFIRRGVALETMDLGAACRTFNILVQEERRVGLALLFGGDGRPG